MEIYKKKSFQNQTKVLKNYYRWSQLYFENYEKAIILEDDCIQNKSFFILFINA